MRTPYIDVVQPFNLTSAIQSYIDFAEKLHQNQDNFELFLKFGKVTIGANLLNGINNFIKFIDHDSLIQILNPAKKKKERLNAIGNYVNDNDFDVVFLQEIWYKHDHEYIKKQTKKNYHITGLWWTNQSIPFFMNSFN